MRPLLVATWLLGGCSSPCPPSAEGAPDAPAPLCLDIHVQGENGSALWHDLSVWAFAQSPEIDDAAKKVAGLETPAQWRSAGRYFQAENFHGLERPACDRADRREGGTRTGPGVQGPG